MYEYQNKKNIFAKGFTPNWSEEIFVIKTIKNTVRWAYDINDLNSEEIIETFYEKALQKTNQEAFRIEKLIEKRGNKLMSNGKDMIINLIAGFIKKTYYK